MFIGSKQLPKDVISMGDFIEGNYIYVDKTDLIAQMLLGGKGSYFLSRPRRFGKITLINTLQDLFENGLKHFAGLKIAKYTEKELNIEKRYKVLRLSFTSCQNDLKEKYFEDVYISQLKQFFKSLDIKIGNDMIVLPEILEDGLSQLDKPIVLLIEEYDAPLTSVFDDAKEFDRRKKLLKSFLQIIKEHSGKFRFMLITGMPAFYCESAFFDFNVTFDISLDPEFASITGFTQDELEHYFAEYIDNAADVLSQKEGKTYDRADILELLKKYYGGYSFDITAKCHVYNPWSVLNFLAKPELGFANYWVNFEAPYLSLLRKYLEKSLTANA